MSTGHLPTPTTFIETTAPPEVARVRLEPGETLIVRVTDLTPNQAREYEEYLQAGFPEHPVRVICAEQILVAGPGESTTGQPRIPAGEIEYAGVVTVDFAQISPIANFATLEVRDAYSGEHLIGMMSLNLVADGERNEVAAQITEVLGKSGHPIRQSNAREPLAPAGADGKVKTITRAFLVASRPLEPTDA